MTPKAKKTINKIKQTIQESPIGISFSELMEKTKLSSPTLQNALTQIDGLKIENDQYFLPKQPQKEQPMTDKHLKNHAIKNDPPANQAEPTKQAEPEPTKPKKRHKPYTPNPTRGYEISKKGVKIFLDRRASSRTLTLTIADLKELIHAVEKVAKDDPKN